MINRKIVCTAMASAILAVGIQMVYAGSSNDLLRMDVKKSSAQDTVDVTFYTTGSPMNSVVTRKSGNSYVVLLPNVSGSQSVVPSLGGVKDLVSDISVKNVDDGIGGYTKVTFTTTKPVRISTFTKQTAPLTSAQQDYKNLIAKSSNIKPISNTTATQPAAQTKQAAPVQKQTAQASKTASQAQKTAATTSAPKKSVSSQSVKAAAPAVKSAAQPKAVSKPVDNKTKTTKATAQAAKTVKKAEAPKENVVKQESKQVKPETKVVKSEVKESPANTANVAETTPIQTAQPETVQVNNEVKTVAPAPVTKKVSKTKVKNDIKKTVYTNPIVPVAGAFCLFGIFLLAGLAGIITKGVEDKRNRLKEYMEEQAAQTPKQTNPEFQAIMDDKKSNWQEKYKRYTKVSAEQKRVKNQNKMSYIADVATSKGVIVPDEQLTQKRLQETISRMEHSLSQTPVSEPSEEYSNRYHSEDDMISKAMSEVKLKSFARPVDLSQTGRNLVSFEELENRKKTLKEGKFVKLNSPLSVSKRKSASSGMNFASIVRSGEKHNTNKATMDKQQEEYVMSSLNEYMNMLDSEQTSVPMIQQPQELSKALENATTELANSKSVVTNPMAHQRKSPFAQKQSAEINGLSIRSSYNIDSDRNIYMVDLDGISAIIGKIGEEIFVLKKFDKIINKPMQVRLDYGNTYIVRVGAFKCLVDVTENKMGTLLEI